MRDLSVQGYRRRMADLVRAVATADIPEGAGRLWRHGDKRIALFRTPAGVYAADNRCPHQGYALKDGDIRGDVLTCAWLGRFDIDSDTGARGPTRTRCWRRSWWRTR